MEEKDFVNVQMEIANECIEVIEGVFIGVVVGLLILGITTVCILL